jgi:hypothetical protein
MHIHTCGETWDVELRLPKTDRVALFAAESALATAAEEEAEVEDEDEDKGDLGQVWTALTA